MGRFIKGDKALSISASKRLVGKIGKEARRWKGESASYSAKHCWIIKHYGKANKCNNPLCKSEKPKRFEWANISGAYLRDINDYEMLCPSCHRKKDKGNYCKKGHKYTKKNTYIRKQGWRACKICMKIASEKHRNKNNYE